MGLTSLRMCGEWLEVYYDSGVLEEDGVEVRRTCWFVFVRKR